MQNKLATLSIILSFFLGIILFFVFLELASINERVGTLEINNKEIALVSGGQTPPAVAKQKIAQEVIMEVSDLGFSPGGIHISSNEFVKISVTNKGEKPHSFVIDELNIDSGAIEPGQTKELEFGQNIQGTASFRFYSNLEGDDKEIMTGSIMVF